MQNIPKIGEPWPEQGGVNAGLMRGVNGKPDYFLIISSDPSGKNSGLEWGGYGTQAPGATCEFDGLLNTTDLLKAETDHPAASFAAGVVIDGHNDFYLPARRELSLMYANCPELFETSWHWSSTQFSADNAWVQDFGGGSQRIGTKCYSYAVRAVRRYYPLNNSAI
jgi:hypothetical protein